MAYSFFRTLTIDHTKCGAANSTDFPALFSGTYTYLKTVGNGGLVTNANGYDIAFYADVLGTSMLDFELVYYDATTGTVEFWVRIPTLSSSADTVIYLFYANASITTNQSTTSTWSSEFLGRWHFPNGSSLSVADSTSNGKNGTIVGGVTAAAGKIDGCGSYDGSTGYVNLTTLTTGTSVATWGFWIYPNNGNGMVGWSLPGTAGAYISRNAGDIKIWVSVAPFTTATKSNETIPTTAWSRVIGVARGGGGTPKIYLNGVECTYSDVGSGGAFVANTGYRIGAYQDASLKVDGLIDEAFFTNDIKSASWIIADYNNQNSPSTFYAVGAQQSAGGGGGASRFGASGNIVDNLGSVRSI